MIKETVATLEKLISRSSWLTGLYSRPYAPVVQNEIELAQITSADRVLSIGCGAVPFTALLVARMTGARVTAVDRDPVAARLAEACVARCGLADQVQIVCCDAADAVPGAVDVAIVALQAEPKGEILSALFAANPPLQRVIVRLPSERFASQYDLLPGSWPIAAQVAQNMKTFDRSALVLA